MTAGQGIEIERDGSVGVIWLSSPTNRNRLSMPVLDALAAAIEEISQNASVLVLAARGAAFSLGHDIEADANKSAEEQSQVLTQGYFRVIRLLKSLRMPTIAAVQGPAVGSGASLALACDTVMVSERGSFSLPNARLGMVPDAGVIRFLVGRIGQVRTMELCLSGDAIPAGEAVQEGIASGPIARRLFEETWRRQAHAIAGISGVAVQQIRVLVEEATRGDLDDFLALEARAQSVCLNDPDSRRRFSGPSDQPT